MTYDSGDFGLKALLACVSAPTDPRDAEIAALQQENAALRERLAAWESTAEIEPGSLLGDALLQAGVRADPSSTDLSRALSLPNTTDCYGR